ncbi:MAG: EamA family transporter [Clostridia bacterium]|nr:EamA family transporter [Clostridia bacterium]
MSGILAFLWVCLLVALASAKVTLQGKVSRTHFQNAQDPVLFNGILFIAIAGVMALVFPLTIPNTTMILSALSVSVFTFLFQTTYAMAMGCGPVSLTVLIVTFSQFITITASVILYDEKIYLTQLIGMAFLILSMFLNLKSDGENKKAMSLKWLIPTIVAMLANGVASTLQKVFGKNNVGIEGADTTFLCLIYLFAALFAFLLFTLRRHTGVHTKATMRIGKAVLLYTLAIAAILAIYQKCYMIALVEIDSAVLFPTHNGLQSLVMTFIGVLFFKDKLSKRQWLGVACGLLCIVLMNLTFGISF